MPVFGIDLAAARAPQCARQDKPEQTCRAWYKSPVWKAIKRHRLSQEPNCRQCAQKGCFSRRRALIMSRLMEISGRGLWIMRTRKACAPGTTTPRDDLGNESLTSGSIALRQTQFASHSDSLDSKQPLE